MNSSSGFVPPIVRIVVVVLGAIALASAQAPQPTFLGVVKEDGTLIPIGISDGADWWNRWPWGFEGNSEITSFEIPPTVDEIPESWLPPSGIRLPRDWTLQTASGRRVKIRLRGPVGKSPGEFMETVALQTDYPGRPLRDGEQYYKEIGVAIAGDGWLGRFVNPSLAESSRLMAALNARLRSLEKASLAEWTEHRRESRAGDAAPLTLTPAFREGDSTREAPFDLVKAARPFNDRIYYFLTGEKLYRISPNDHCKVNVRFEGVVIANRNGSIASEKISAPAWAEYCGDAASWTEPLATLHWRSRLLWILKVSLEDGYVYTLFDPTSSRVVELKGMRLSP